MFFTTLLKQHKTSFLAIVLSCFLYYYFAFEVVRTNFTSLILSFTALFLLFLYLTKQNLNWKVLVGISVLFRLLFLLATPNLSQDFYRFIWDGRMLLNGFNPYLYLPKNIFNSCMFLPEQATALVNRMGNLNASHYSNYPPLNQLCFFIAALLSKNSILGSIVVFRVILLAADMGVIYFGKKLLISLNLQPKLIFLYVLNPFVIIELFGNLHFEGVMIFFLVWSIYLLQQQKWKWAAVVFACSISLKLLPLLFLPLFFKQLPIKKLIGFYVIVGSCVLLTFLPFLSEDAIAHFSTSVSLWFGTFEFNGSLYLLASEISYQFLGWHPSKIIGKITPVLVILFVLYQAFINNKKNTRSLIASMLFALSFYLFTASTVHPWYVAMLLLLSIFTRYRFALLWSFTIMLSYSFYQNNAFTNNYWLIGLEYGLVFGLFIWELLTHKKRALP